MGSGYNKYMISDISKEELEYLKDNFTVQNRVKISKYLKMLDEKPDLYKRLGGNQKDIYMSLRYLFDTTFGQKGRKYNKNTSKKDRFCVDKRKKPLVGGGFSFGNKPEKIEDFIRSFYTGNIIKEQSQMGEILVFPERNIAVHYCSLFKVSEVNVRKNNLLALSDSYAKRGIRSLHVYEDEWEYRRDIVKSIIKVALGYYDEKIFARKCKVRYLSKEEEKIFFNRNHLQGFSSSQFCIGLIYNNEVVSAISIAKPRFSNEADWELIRYANKLNTQIIGGFGKLFAFFRDNYTGSIISYSDRRLFSGGLYRKMFTELEPSGLGYFYTNGDIRENRQKFQKFKLAATFPEWMDETEWEIAHRLHWYRVYDCGNWRFIN